MGTVKTIAPIRTIAAVALALFVIAPVATGCAPDRREAAPAAGTTPDEVSAAATFSAVSVGPQVGHPAADFTLESVDGADVTLSSLQGKAVVIAFWATWCQYCREELPRIAELYEEVHDDGLEVLAVNVREEPERVAAYAAELDLPYPVLMDRRGEVATRYRVRGLPTTVFVDPEGDVQRVHLGTLEEPTLQAYVDAVLPQGS